MQLTIVYLHVVVATLQLQIYVDSNLMFRLMHLNLTAVIGIVQGGPTVAIRTPPKLATFPTTAVGQRNVKQKISLHL